MRWRCCRWDLLLEYGRVEPQICRSDGAAVEVELDYRGRKEWNVGDGLCLAIEVIGGKSVAPFIASMAGRFLSRLNRLQLPLLIMARMMKEISKSGDCDMQMSFTDDTGTVQHQ
jgi:hypothetical protein